MEKVRPFQNNINIRCNKFKMLIMLMNCNSKSTDCIYSAYEYVFVYGCDTLC